MADRHVTVGPCHFPWERDRERDRGREREGVPASSEAISLRF